MKATKYKYLSILLIAVLALSLLAGCGGGGSDSADEGGGDTPASAVQEETPEQEPDITETPDTGGESASTHVISEEEKAYREACMPVSDIPNSYDLFVYDSSTESYSSNEEYVGVAMMLEGKIRFLFEFNGSAAYMFDTLNESGFAEDSFLIVDMREDSDPELKEGDLITVYGDYYGVEPVTKEMSAFSAVIPRFDMRYVERAAQ